MRGESSTSARELISWFLQRRGLQLADAEDVTQQVITKLVSGLRGFEYDPEKGGLRPYLYRCVRNGLADFRTRQVGAKRAVEISVAEAGEISGPDVSQGEFEREWADHHYRLAVRRYRLESDARGIALLEGTIAGRSVASLSEETSMTEGAVYKAQQRMRDRLKELVAEQVRDEGLGHERRPE